MRTLGETVRLDARTKLLNPKWYEGMLSSGYEGVREIQKRLTNTMGWSATSGALPPPWRLAGLLALGVLPLARSLPCHTQRAARSALLPPSCPPAHPSPPPPPPRQNLNPIRPSYDPPPVRTGMVDNWVYDEANSTFIEDPEMAARLLEANPNSFRKLVATFLEANGRGYWDATPEQLDRLRQMYTDVEDKIEGVE